MIQLESGKNYAWQWDLGHRLILEDIQPGTEVHFSKCTMPEALVMVPYADGEKRVVDVPNILLQDAEEISVYIYCAEKVVHTACINVYERPKPSDYVYTETEVKRYETLAKRIPFDETYEGQLLYISGGVARPLKLGPGLSIRDGILYVSGGTGEPDDPVGVVVTVTTVAGVEVLVDSSGQIVAQLDGTVEVVTDSTGTVTASIIDGVETISVKEVL